MDYPENELPDDPFDTFQTTGEVAAYIWHKFGETGLGISSRIFPRTPHAMTFWTSALNCPRQAWDAPQQLSVSLPLAPCP
jgi:hypothetical protein